jgi:hypothetical protein
MPDRDSLTEIADGYGIVLTAEYRAAHGYAPVLTVEDRIVSRSSKGWVAANVDTLAIATGICPTCATHVLGVSITGGTVTLKGVVPKTKYTADVLISLHDGTHVAIEVGCLTHKKWAECTSAGTVVYEVEAAEIQRAIAEGSKILCTTTLESVVCAECVI